MHFLAIPVAVTGLGLLIGGHYANWPAAKNWGIGLLCAAPVLVMLLIGKR
jgi:hypothetical protein